MNSEKRASINWKSIIAQSLILSISIYIPFYLDNWHSDNVEAELNEKYKNFLWEDLNSDLENIDILINSNQIFIDSTQTIFTAEANDSLALADRSNKALMQGLLHEFNSLTDITFFIEQFRNYGNEGDLQLIRSLNSLRIGYRLISMIDNQREDYRLNYHTPFYINNYSIKEGFPKAIDLAYFNSDHFINTISILFNLSLQTDRLYKNTRLLIIEVMNNLDGHTLDSPSLK